MQRYTARSPEGEKQAAAPSQRKKGSTVVAVKDVLYLSLDHWKWFVLSVIVAVGAGIWYYQTTPPVYQRTCSILIKSKGGNEHDGLLREFGIESTSSNLSNEMELLRTHQIADEIVKRLNLNVEYFTKGAFHENVLYGVQAPVKVSFLTLPEDDNVWFNLKVNGDRTVTISSDSEINGKKIAPLTMPLDRITNTSWGKIRVEATPAFDAFAGQTIKVVHRDFNTVAKDVRDKIRPSLRNKTGTIIDIKYNDTSIARADTVLNTLVAIYNENWLQDRNIKTINTDKFIKERLAIIESELGDVEQNLSDWKSEHLMLNVDEAGHYAQSQINETERALQEINNQIYMTLYIKNYLTDDKHANELLPVNSGITNSSIESLISEYNTTLLKRNNHLITSSPNNPVVTDLEANLATLKGSILQSLDYELTMLEQKEKVIRDRRGLAVSRIASNPEKAQELVSVERQQKLKEGLYLYLLEKREENELTQAFDAYNNKYIEAPSGSTKPVEPSLPGVILTSLAIGLFLPIFVIGTKEIFNTKVRGRKDLEDLNVPYAGDIPLYPGAKALKPKKGAKGSDSTPALLIKEHSRDIINEAFRVVRSNLEFMLGFDTGHKVVMVTSFIPGSGKTFITANLAAAIALGNRKVLAIDLDLRRGALSRFIGERAEGLSGYLSGRVADYHDIIHHVDKVDIIPAGQLPPNPSELLLSPRFKEFMESVREEYDYVFLDCPPAQMVADASIVGKYADLTLFIIRTGSIEREMLPELEDWYETKKFGNLAIILNGEDASPSRHTSHKYGYHKYGYNYSESDSKD